MHYVARQLGHSPRLTLETYGHVIDELDHAPSRRGRRDHAGAQRPAARASGPDRIVGVMSAAGPYDTMSSNCGRGATMGPPACSDQSSPVAFRRCRRGGLQGLRSSWGDWRGQKVFLISVPRRWATRGRVKISSPALQTKHREHFPLRKRSQVRVLDRPSSESRNYLHLINGLGSGLLEDRHGLGAPRGHMGHPVTCEAKKRSWVPAATPSAPTPAGGLLKSRRDGEPDGRRVAAATAEGKSPEDARERLRFVRTGGEVGIGEGCRSAR